MSKRTNDELWQDMQDRMPEEPEPDASLGGFSFDVNILDKVQVQVPKGLMPVTAARDVIARHGPRIIEKYAGTDLGSAARAEIGHAHLVCGDLEDARVCFDIAILAGDRGELGVLKAAQFLQSPELGETDPIRSRWPEVEIVRETGGGSSRVVEGEGGGTDA